MRFWSRVRRATSQPKKKAHPVSGMRLSPILRQRGERLYEPGPWDETCAWLVGSSTLDDAPLRPPARRSVAFRDSGYVVLRGREGGAFTAFRCGSLKDRFSQIDMLHVDVWWRGQNVLVDPGSYVYNGSPEWHRHFLGTESHNTIAIDGRDQMLHFRQFKILYWTEAKLLARDASRSSDPVSGSEAAATPRQAVKGYCTISLLEPLPTTAQ